ncbi:MAG TPA: MBL fold metallo-hydrolase [Alphaproteobacteria bacterium]|nr:MBL fold metallo-hydrolase [Alphaproteobacteria bacterium]
MENSDRFTVKFWGVRGSIACPGPDYVRYGGNTSCVEIRCGPNLLIFDGGTGLRPLGRDLDANGVVDADLFFTHTHFDHITGLPFFSSAFKRENRFRFWAGHLLPEHRLYEVLCELMMAPFFPVPLDVLKATIEYVDFKPWEDLEPRSGVIIRTAPLNHPNGAIGYRVEYRGRSICYVTDTEHVPGKLDENICSLVKGADIMIYDSTYTEAEFPRFAGWGHSTWEEGVRISMHAGVKTLVVFHHDPTHDDAFMDRVAKAANDALPGTIIAHEGLVLTPGRLASYERHLVSGKGRVSDKGRPRREGHRPGN